MRYSTEATTDYAVVRGMYDILIQMHISEHGIKVYGENSIYKEKYENLRRRLYEYYASHDVELSQCIMTAHQMNKIFEAIDTARLKMEFEHARGLQDTVQG